MEQTALTTSVPSSVADALSTLQPVGEPIAVSLSNELVHLLSDQLYQSPIKAIEELVVNSYDADAEACCVYVPSPSQPEKDFITVFDNGVGMTHEGLTDLWQIGRSNKRTEEIERRRHRKQIGKFGVGKLAARTIANKMTYITKVDSQILTVTIDFNDFAQRPSETGSGNGSPQTGTPNAASTSATEAINRVETRVRQIDNWDEFANSEPMKSILEHTFADEASTALTSSKKDLKEPDLAALLYKLSHWTLVVLEVLTPKGKSMKQSMLKWVLSTAMPLVSDFKLFLNGKEIKSSKLNLEEVFRFDLGDLPDERLKNLKDATGIEWKKVGKALRADTFPSGVTGTAIVTKSSLYGGKSDDLSRSHGFFIKVRNRLVDYKDALFGLKPLTYETFNRLRVEVQADDLDDGITVSRDTVEETHRLIAFRFLLREVFNEASTRYERSIDKEPNPKKEGERNEVSYRLVEYPVADVLVSQADSLRGAEADESWFYLDLPGDADVTALVADLYTPNRQKYQYERSQQGRANRLVKFDPKTATFWINEDHDFVREYAQEVATTNMLHDVVTAEALLEVYLRQHHVPLSIIGEVLEQRDKLLRSLAKDHSFSFETVSSRLRDAASDKYELEISLVVAARSLGFTATHVAGAGEPDGLALFNDYPDGEKKITLEAKSSVDVPSLGAIDFAGLYEHVTNHKADGCLLVAPDYPGNTEEDNAARRRAELLKISCWTVKQLADFVEAAEKRQLNAKHVLEIVLNNFAPDAVAKALDKILADPEWQHVELYRAIFKALEELEGYFPRMKRTVDMIIGRLVGSSVGATTSKQQVIDALRDMEGASQGGMKLRDGEGVALLVSLPELKRRLSALLKEQTEPRRKSSFRKDDQT
ncbi:MAG TPA: ATP-binding protein [Pyrinomonadaceae bacterium]